LIEQQLTPASRRSSDSYFPRCRAATLLVYLTEELGARRADPPRYTVEEKRPPPRILSRRKRELDRHAIVVVDEATYSKIAERSKPLRLLLNFEVDAKPTLSLVLVGQMGLVSAVSRLPSLAERVAVSTLLRAFTAEETVGYVKTPPQAAGANRNLFTPDALEALHYLGHGIPRQINRLADLRFWSVRRPPQRITAEQIEAVSERAARHHTGLRFRSSPRPEPAR